MRVHIHVKCFFDWIPVPDGTQITAADLASNQMKPSANGSGYLMRVPKVADTCTDVMIPENQIIATIIHTYTDKGKQGIILTRAEAVAEHLSTMVIPHHTNRRWMKHIEVHDDEPSEDLFLEMIKPHLEADHGRAPGKNIDAEDVDDMVKAYMQPMTPEKHRDHLHTHFKLKPHVEKPKDKASPKGAV